MHCYNHTRRRAEHLFRTLAELNSIFFLPNHRNGDYARQQNETPLKTGEI
jgi:hypothetical protein